MSNPSIPETEPVIESTEIGEPTESFDKILSQYEKSHSRRSGDGGKQIDGF